MSNTEIAVQPDLASSIHGNVVVFNGPMRGESQRWVQNVQVEPPSRIQDLTQAVISNAKIIYGGYALDEHDGEIDVVVTPKPDDQCAPVWTAWLVLHRKHCKEYNRIQVLEYAMGADKVAALTTLEINLSAKTDIILCKRLQQGPPVC